MIVIKIDTHHHHHHHHHHPHHHPHHRSNIWKQSAAIDHPAVGDQLRVPARPWHAEVVLGAGLAMQMAQISWVDLEVPLNGGTPISWMVYEGKYHSNR